MLISEGMAAGETVPWSNFLWQNKVVPGGLDLSKLCTGNIMLAKKILLARRG
jgi:hypothetical protein